MFRSNHLFDWVVIIYVNVWRHCSWIKHWPSWVNLQICHLAAMLDVYKAYGKSKKRAHSSPSSSLRELTMCKIVSLWSTKMSVTKNRRSVQSSPCSVLLLPQLLLDFLLFFFCSYTVEVSLVLFQNIAKRFTIFHLHNHIIQFLFFILIPITIWIVHA